MKLTTKINLSISAVYLISLLACGWYFKQLTEEHALHQVTDQAELLLQQAMALRTYTVNEIRPLADQARDNSRFHSQSVPAYAATQVANLFQKARPEYSYKEAVFNPTNPRDNAAPWEESVIHQFIAQPELDKVTGSRIVNRVKSLYIARPIRISNPDCLECHSTPAAAPRTMIAQYGSDGGFGWKLGEVVGTQMVIVPYTLPEQLAGKTLYSILIALTLVFFATLAAINLVLRRGLRAAERV